MLRKAFDAFEIDDKKKIPADQISTILEMLGVGQPPATINSLRDEFDPWSK